VDLAQFLLLDLGWFFFAAWAIVLGVVSVIAFASDLNDFLAHRNPGMDRL
jgi:hypothetical protein